MEKKLRYYRLLRWACRLVVLAATGTSVWANILHSNKNPAAIFINILPPLLILGGWELASRMPMAQGVKWYSIKIWGGPLAMLGIIGIGAWLSYWHQKDAFFRYSMDVQTALLLPFAIDGLMLMASVYVFQLNDAIERLETAIAVPKTASKTSNANSDVLPPKSKEPELTRRQLIAVKLAQFPEMSPQEIANLTGSKLNYVYKVISDLRTESKKVQAEPVLVGDLVTA